MAMASGVAAVMMIVWIVILAASVVSIIGLWKMFEKAGYAGWKSLIPILNVYIMFEISGNKKLFPVLIVSNILYVISMVWRSVIYASDPSASSPFLTALAVLGVISAVVMFIVVLKMLAGLAVAFGQGMLWFFLLLFFAPVMFVIMGFAPSISFNGPLSSFKDANPDYAENNKSRFENPYTSYKD
ncbi:MAG: hypothetical protein J6Z42_01370 [Lachnospiraceae bacterium]|nr:hypothetical protein [Lachnospiraceae bacterium]